MSSVPEIYFQPMSDISQTHIDVFQMTTELTQHVSNLQLPYNGVLAAFMGIGV